MSTLNLNEPAESQLASCMDCGGMVSRKAESCPKCGRFFQSLRVIRVVPGNGWSRAVAWGIILSSIIVMIMVAVFWFFIIALIAAAMSNAHR